MHSELNFADYFTCDEYYKRERVVSAALTLLKAEARAGIGIDVPGRGGINTKKKYNPVKEYADWIQEALKIPDGKSNPSPADE